MLFRCEPNLKKASSAASEVAKLKREKEENERTTKQEEAEREAVHTGLTNILNEHPYWSGELTIEVSTRDLVRLIIKHYDGWPEGISIATGGRNYYLIKIEKKWKFGTYLILTFDVK